jgi:hypothetical protein
MNRPETTRQIVRLQTPVRKWLEQEAASEMMPMNSVVNRILKRAMQDAERQQAERRADVA